MGSRENSVNRQSVLHSRENSRDANLYSRENGLLQDGKVAPDAKHLAASERSHQPMKPQSAKEKPKQMTDEEVEKKMTAIIDEFLNIKDLRVWFMGFFFCFCFCCGILKIGNLGFWTVVVEGHLSTD